MFDILTSLTKAAVGVATLPVSVAADVLTLGGLSTDEKTPYTVQKLKRIGENIDNATEPK